ncbi:MAG TPA: hydrogen peroxide-dependent heme synthase [Isosphaeraceae bacterium]|nr:hydrogen peroxide-dependent heme synthase [Isosphaeraceae bacterium]
MSQPDAPTQAPGSGSSGRPGAHPGASTQVEATLVPESGWHFVHLFYRIDRAQLARIPEADRRRGREEIAQALDPTASDAPNQLQAFSCIGHKADFGALMAGTDLWKLHGVQTAIQASALGPALVPTYSFYSITEVSEYVPDVDQYGKILREREGMDPEGTQYQTRLKQYQARLGAMNRQRMYPEFPDWPVVCFYPMSKMRQDGQNWYLLPFDERSEMMSEHGKSGMKFAGRVSQVITASTGLDDWEWGVTLWAKNPSYLKDIVYTMRFDRSSAQYALFGPFYPGFMLPAHEVLRAVRL